MQFLQDKNKSFDQLKYFSMLMKGYTHDILIGHHYNKEENYK